MHAIATEVPAVVMTIAQKRFIGGGTIVGYRPRGGSARRPSDLIGVLGTRNKESKTEAASSLCTSLTSLETSLKNLTSLPSSATKTDYQTDVPAVQDDWSQVKTAIGFGAIFGLIGLVLAAPLTSAAVRVSRQLAAATAQETAVGGEQPPPDPGSSPSSDR